MSTFGDSGSMAPATEILAWADHLPA
jgi:hypothetical protein